MGNESHAPGTETAGIITGAEFPATVFVGPARGKEILSAALLIGDIIIDLAERFCGNFPIALPLEV